MINKKLTLIILFSLLFNFLMSFNYEIKEEQFKVKNINDIINYLKKNNIKGEKIEKGLLQELFKLISLRDFGGLYNEDRYSITIWVFEKNYGFDFTEKLFKIITMFSDTAIFKNRPYIIVITGRKSEKLKILIILKDILPNMVEIGERENL